MTAGNGAQSGGTAAASGDTVAQPHAGHPLPAALRIRLAAEAAQFRALRRELEVQKRLIEQQQRRIEALQNELAAQENQYLGLRKSLDSTALDVQRAGTARAADGPATQPMPGPDSTAPDTQAQAAQQPVGTAPASDNRPPSVAPIFDQPGVLTPRGKFVLEPSYQFGYSSTDRVALVGYTIIPALLIGLIDVQQIRSTTQVAELTARYGITNRMEIEVRVPYVDGYTDTTGREILTGSAINQVFTTRGKGLGDVESTLRYQFNNGGADQPYYVGWLRFKSRTGTDPFEVATDCVQTCLPNNTTGTGLPLQIPTGSGFYSLQPGLTWLFPSDPVVFFGNVSYLHNFPRDNVSLTLVNGAQEPLGNVHVGDVFDASVGMGLALNDRALISFGYDQSLVGTTTANGQTLAGSTRTVLGSLLIGGSYKLNDHHTLNVTLGVGVTRDTPDVTLTVRLPTTF
ncbi:MAG: coiled-coil domain-containing protein [Rhodanobacteraceae bacterium]